MKVFIIEHKGMWPVGAYSVVSAIDDINAIEVFKSRIQQEKPNDYWKKLLESLEIGDFKMREFDTSVPNVDIISIGDY